MHRQPEHSLSITRLIPVPRPVLYRAWTEHLGEWWAPRPYTTPEVELDLRPGGVFRTQMVDGDGNLHPEGDPGVVLEAIPNERIAFTDAFLPGWVPSAAPFMVGVFTFADEDGGTRYTASAWHWKVEDRKAHEEMGFEVGWGIAADQLEEVAKRIAS
ncbi:SRPBCC family protein [Pelagibacterium montanilacus]|uniref:SRPBCC family protein n=1 Tax=Pelagibacterium montanilacus TaxID=2185280 RepID=UPI000F8DD155|nr:SRPBCC family protein [Pelagibacterium montanilacus]